MTYRGHIQNGQIIMDPPIHLPEGARVTIEVQEGSEPSWAEVFKDLIGKAEGLPADMAENHDHYIHGSPKK